MNDSEMELSLRAGSDEPAVGSLESRRSPSGGSARRFTPLALKHPPRMYFRDAIGGGASLLGEFLIPIAQVVVPALGVVLVGWLQGRAGRKVRLKVGDVEVEARTPEEVEFLLQHVKEFQSKPTKAKDEGQP